MESEKISILCVVFFIALITWLVRYKWRRRRIYEIMNKMQMPPGLPILGHIFLLMKPPDQLLKIFTDYIFKYGPNYALWLLHIPIVTIVEPRDLEILMQSPKCLSKGYFYDFIKVVVGEGLFTASAKKWRKHRKIIQPTFNSKILNSFIPIFANTSSICVNEILPKYVGKYNVDWFKIFSSTNLDVICQTAMGVKTDTQRSDFPIGLHLERGMYAVFSRISNVFLHPEFIYQFSRTSAKLKEAVTSFKNFTTKVIEQKKQEFQREIKVNSVETAAKTVPIKRKVALEMLLELDSKGMKFTDQELLDEAMTFFVGGTDTSSITCCFFLSMMGMHQDIQEEVYREILDVLEPNRIPTMEELNKLEVLERCLKETLRIFSPVPIISRRVGNSEIQLSSCTVPAESFVILPIFFIHRNPNYWKNPLKFDPDRFLPEAATKRHPYTFIPFSGGLRSCVGMRYSYMNLKNLTSMILRKYKIYCDYKSIEEIELLHQLVIRPVHGYKFRLVERPK